MKQTLFGALAICLALTAAAAAQKQITLLATVTDPSGGSIDAIDPKDVRVTENDAAAAVIKSEVVNRIPKVHLLIDNGVGIPAESQADVRVGKECRYRAWP